MTKTNEIYSLIEEKAIDRLKRTCLKEECFKYTDFDDFAEGFDLRLFITSNSDLTTYLKNLCNPDFNKSVSKRDLMRCMLEELSFSEVRALEGFVSHDDMYEDFLKNFTRQSFEKLSKSNSVRLRLNEFMSDYYNKCEH